LVARGIQGVLIAPLSEGAGLEGLDLEWRHFALATIEHTFIEPRLHKACSDEFSTIGRLIQRLLDYGYGRIGIAMHSRMDDHANHFWLAGYQAFQALSDESQRLPHFITPEWNRDNFLKWYRCHTPEAIITVNEDVLKWLRSDGIDVPGEAGCATIYWKEHRAGLSGFYQNHELMGAGAVDLVVGQLNRNERGLPESDKTMLVQAAWREGLTLRRRTPEGTRAELRVWTR
jgi:DNA-binding LacI/PurR family transcriptional regulator